MLSTPWSRSGGQG